MTAQPCHCAELEAVVEKLTLAMRKIQLEAIEQRIAQIADEVFFTMLPTLSSLLARREAERKVVEAARTALYDAGDGMRIDNCDPCADKLRDALVALDALDQKA